MDMFLFIGNLCPYLNWTLVAAGSKPPPLDLTAQLISVLQILHNVRAFFTQLSTRVYVTSMSHRCMVLAERSLNWVVSPGRTGQKSRLLQNLV